MRKVATSSSSSSAWGSPGSRRDGEAPAVALADQRRARRQREPLGDRRGQPRGVLGRPEVLEPALGIDAGELDLPIAVQEHHGGARHRLGGQHAIQALARPRGSQRVLEARVGDVEHIAVTLGELALRSAERGDDHLAATGAHANRDLVLHTRRVQQVAVKLAAREESGLDQLGEPHGSAPAGGQERMASRAPDDRLEGSPCAPPRPGPRRGGGRRWRARHSPRSKRLSGRARRALGARDGATRPPSGLQRSSGRRQRRCQRARAWPPPPTIHLALRPAPSPGRARAPAQAAGAVAAVRRPLRSLARRRR